MESQRLNDTWAKELLGPHLQDIRAAQKALKDAVELANSSLKKSRIARLVATEAGYPNGTIMVDSAGAILITFKASAKTSKEEEKKTPKTKMRSPKVIEVKKAGISKVKADTGKREWKSDLPTLEVLRAQAESRSVDITHLGRKRKDIYALLQGMDTPTEVTPTEVTPTDLQLVETEKAVPKVVPAPVGQSSGTDEVKTERQTVVRRRRKKDVLDLATAITETESVDLDQILEG